MQIRELNESGKGQRASAFKKIENPFESETTCCHISYLKVKLYWRDSLMKHLLSGWVLSEPGDWRSVS